MNKLGFYIENTTVGFLRDALRAVKPPAILIHAGDRGLLRDIRRELAPDAFIVGRMFAPLSEQGRWLTTADPVESGRAFADTILSYDFGYATERGTNGRLLIDAWMVLNEAIRGPASFPSGQLDAETIPRAQALDRFQVAFRERLQTRGLEAVAFNFAAGNFTQPSHYLDWFPGTLASYKYLGFHEYGWPTLMPKPGTETAALYYRRCMEGIRQRYGDMHRVIITELGLARMYKYAADPAGDVGWLYAGDTIPEEQYWESLKWYNDELQKDDYVLGCCLFQIGHSGRWETFRHLGQDNQQHPIGVINRIAALRAEEKSAPPPTDVEDPLQKEKAMRERLNSAKTLLTTIIQQTSRLLDLIGQMDKTLAGLADQFATVPSPEGLQTLARQAETMQIVLDWQVAQAMATPGSIAPADVTEIRSLQARAAALRQGIAGVVADAQGAAGIAGRVAQVRTGFDALATRVSAVKALKQRAEALVAEATSLEQQLGAAPTVASGATDTYGLTGGTAVIPAPAMQDVRGRLPVHEGKTYPIRDERNIKRIVIHHTGIAMDVPPAEIAAAQVKQGKAGIAYHFLVATDGQIYWTQPLEAATDQTNVAAVNADAVGIALAGDFTAAVPTEAQMTSAADLVAWLLRKLEVGPDALYGRGELDTGVASPGAQWWQGSQFKITLLEAVAQRL
jgi:hypothetical protein